MEPLLESGFRNPEHSCGSELIAVGFPKRVSNSLALAIVKIRCDAGGPPPMIGRLEAKLKITDLNCRPGSKRNCPPHRAFQFPDVSRPIMLAQIAHRGVRERSSGVAGLALLEEIIDQQRDISFPLAKRRDIDLHGTQPKKEILAEIPALDVSPQVTRGRRKNAGVKRKRVTGSDGPEFPLLQHGREFTLEMQRKIADFLQQNGTPAGKGEETPPGLSGAGKGSLFISEKLRFG